MFQHLPSANSPGGATATFISISISFGKIMPEMPCETRDARAAIRLKKFNAIINRFDAIINRLDKINSHLDAAQDALIPLLAILKHNGDKNKEYDTDYDEYYDNKYDDS